MRSLHRTWGLCVLLGLCACEAGTSTGNPTAGEGDGTGEIANGGGADCKVDRAQEIAVDAESSLGFKASDVLSFVEGKHEEKLTWNPQDGFTYGPESGEHTVTIEITRKGAPRWTQYTRASNGGANILLPETSSCSDAIELDVQVHVESDQGALDERFDSTLVARNGKQVSLSHRLKDDKTQGSFTVSSVNLPNATVVQLTLDIALGKYGTSGTFTGIVQQVRGDAVSAGFSRQPIARWGGLNCGSDAIAVPRDVREQSYSANDVLALLNRAQTANITFSGEQASSAKIKIDAQSEYACVLLEDDSITRNTLGTMYLPALLRIESSDARIAGDLPVGINAKSSASGELTEVVVAFDNSLLLGVGDFGAQYGLRGIDVSGFDTATAQLNLTASAQQPLTGDLTVNGFTNRPCMPVVMQGPPGSTSAGSCPGALMTQVAKVRISAAP